MPLRNDLNAEVRKILQERWRVSRSRKAINPEELDLDNHGVTVEATVLYADLDQSTSLVDEHDAGFAAQMYKTYLVCAARVILSEQGKVTAYDGDRIMAVYTGRKTAERAVRTAFKINYVVQEIINPAVRELKPDSRYTMKQSIGVDTSKLLVTRTGPRAANDLVWVGRAANYAAKLSSREAPATHVTEAVYAQLPPELKAGNDGRQMWIRTTAREIGNLTAYSSTWHWTL